MTMFSEIDEEHRREDGCMFSHNRSNEPIMLEEYNSDSAEHWKEILKEEKIKCAGCGKPLVEVLKVKEDKEINTAIRVRCPYCSDSSFWYKISGKIYVQAIDGLSITDAPVEKMNGILFTTIKVMKNE
jgi:DNA-directed RNA polymerase subunit RPC12/RpoP